ncbi:hypothetical protein QMO40_07175 [Mannheimia bovis]|uniref:hypothetical protein n=1 Tax=Mannheimia bovis TaxID=2770636 RepID=UPI0024B6F2A4|nr:hypothetical protein [Mannheimia bovis]WHP46410.1 hypothetical protein QMO40_07175 [Mannheimia bovis]
MTTAAGLLAAITGNSFAKDDKSIQLNNVHESVQLVQSLASKVDDVSVQRLFDKVFQLSQKINQLNVSIIQDKFKLSPERFQLLVVIRDLLNLNSTILVEKHEERIRKEFRTQYQAYTNSIIELDYSIARVKEKLNIVRVIDIEGLEISESELAEINSAAKEYAVR